MSVKKTSISRKSLKKRVKAISKINDDKLSNKALLKLINRHNNNKKLTRVLVRLGKRKIFTNFELHKSIELFELTIDALKELENYSLIKNFKEMSKDQLYYALVKSEKLPLEDEVT